MANVLIRQLSESTLDFLRGRARQNRRSLQREIHAILDEAARGHERRRRMIEAADSLRNRVAQSFSQRSDSADLVREDRER